MRRVTHPRRHSVLAAAGACFAASALSAHVTPASSTRRVATYHVLPPVWGGTEWSDSEVISTFGPWNAVATEKAFASQMSDLGSPSIYGTFEFAAALTSTGAPTGTFESADSTLLSKFYLDQPSICTVSGSYTLHRYLTATAVVDVSLETSAGPLYTLHADASAGIEDYTIEGDISEQFLMAPGAYSLNVAASGTASAVTSMIAGTGDGTLNLSLSFELNEAQILDVPGEYRTIAAAIDAAQDFQMIRVAPGTYLEHLALGAKRLVLASASETEQVVLDGEGGNGSLLTIVGVQGADTLVRGFTFRNAAEGSLLPEVGSPAGGGVLVVNAGPRFQRCRFESNHATLGGGLAIHGGGATITDCVFTDNSAVNGGAIRFAPDSFSDVLSISTSTLTCNESLTGGSALAVSGAPQPTVKLIGATICNNSLPAIVATNITFDPTTILCGCPGDLDKDGVVGASDLSILIGGWGSSNPAADLDCSGMVGSEDLASILGAWGAVGNCG